MEAVLLYSSPDQSLSPYKQHIRKPKRADRPFISLPSENLAPSYFHGGLLQTPLPLPPLLPLPIAKPLTNNHSQRSRGLSCASISRRNRKHRAGDQSLTPNKSKPQTNSPKKEDSPRSKNSTSPEISSECLIISSTERLGPDPEDLPKNVSRVLCTSQSSFSNNGASKGTTTAMKEVDKFSGSVALTISPPPPSSLPLPTFSLRTKLTCNAKAAGIDAGATDNLRRLLRLR